MSTENLFFTLYAKHFALKKYYFIIQKQFDNKQDLTTKHNFSKRSKKLLIFYLTHRGNTYIFFYYFFESTTFNPINLTKEGLYEK